ncbi:MAG: short-chain fatty acid transporter [Flavobacteriales bacterium]|nr:short-chain fatty acid transporter [Flavobacteriales bacterium]MEB2341944.1 TIGR00366 family protein [Flavobacteriia bacterium]
MSWLSAKGSNRLLERWIPSSLTFAIVLTAVVALLAVVLTDAGPVEVLKGWGDGLSGLLAFMTQMCLILLLGHMLANTRPMRRLLVRLARVPAKATTAYVFVFAVAAATSLINWGLGLVVGALLARETAVQARDRGIKVHFPLLVAAGYSGFVVWHMGYSGSGPLTAATPGSFLADALGGRTIPVSETTFAPWNMLAALGVIAVCALLLWWAAPKGNDPLVELPAGVASETVADRKPEVVTPADRLDASRGLTLLVGLALVAYLAIHFGQGGSVTLDIVNWTFLALILLLVHSPFEIIRLTQEAARHVGEILLQFPLYAGILGIMASTGLIAIFSNAFVAIAGPHSFGVLALLSAGLVNFFVPSGGGQFAVQGPIMLEAAAKLGVDPAIAIMAVAYGDQWTNMLQPFWALPVLAIAGLKMRDILGYTALTCLGSGVVMAVALWMASW